MSAVVVPFPLRRRFGIVVMRDEDGCWLVLRRSYGWLHTNIRDAYEEARQLARQDAVHIVVQS